MLPEIPAVWAYNPKVIPPKLEAVTAAAPELYLNHYRVRIDPVKSAEMDTLVRFVFTDVDDRALGLHLRKGVVEFIDDLENYAQQPDYTVTLNRQDWGRLFLGESDIGSLIDAGAVEIEGDKEGVITFFSLFDNFEPAARS